MSDFSQSISDRHPSWECSVLPWHSEATRLVVWDCPGTLLWRPVTWSRDWTMWHRDLHPMVMMCPWIVSVISWSKHQTVVSTWFWLTLPLVSLVVLRCDILNHATKFTDRVAIIFAQCFRKVQRIDRINPYFHPVGDFNLPNETYILPDGTEKYVRTCFQMWERRDYKRKIFGNTPYTEFFRQVPFEEGWILSEHKVQPRQILEGLAYPETGKVYNSNSGRFMKGGKDLILQYDWTKVARFALVPVHRTSWHCWGLRSPNTEKYLVHGILYDLMNGVYDETRGVKNQPF